MTSEKLAELEKLVTISLEEGEYLDLTFDEAGAELHSTMFHLIGLAEENAALRQENERLRGERDEARRGIMELYHLETITMSRARELMGETSIVPARELYKQLRPEFDKELGDMGYAGREG